MAVALVVATTPLRTRTDGSVRLNPTIALLDTSEVVVAPSVAWARLVRYSPSTNASEAIVTVNSTSVVRAAPVPGTA